MNQENGNNDQINDQNDEENQEDDESYNEDEDTDQNDDDDQENDDDNGNSENEDAIGQNDINKTKAGKQLLNGFNIDQNIKLFELRSKNLEIDVAQLYSLMDQDNGKVRETTFFRVREKLTEKYEKLKSMDEEIRIMGNPTMKSYKKHIKKNEIDQLTLKVETALEICETALDDMIKTESHKEGKPSSSNIKLPHVKIPIFNGCYKEWQTFYDLFSRLIHDNKELSEAVKMQYLMNNVRYEAKRLIAHLTGKAENYDIAWNLLNHKYNNRRMVVTENFKKLMQLPEIEKESYRDLQELHDEIYKCIYSLQNAVSVKEWGHALILHILTKKIDKETFKSYEETLKNPKEVQSLNDFLEFLSERVIHLESVENNFHKKIWKTGRQDSQQQNHQKTVKCNICDGEHDVKMCKSFALVSLEKRLEKVRNEKRCANCLKIGHMAKNCKSRYTCGTCKKSHHTLLHYDQNSKKSNSDQTKEEPKQSSKKTMNINQEKGGIILTTMVIQVNVNGYNYKLRALLDQGSTANIMTEEAAKMINMQLENTHTEISGVGESIKVAKKWGKLKIRSLYNDEFEMNTDVFILDKVTGTTPNTDITENWEYLEHLQLADPKYKKAAPIDIIVGGGVYARIILSGIIKGNPDEPIAQQTELGWIISGNNNNSQVGTAVVSMVIQNDVQFDLEKFWRLEEVDSERMLTLEENECEIFFKNTCKRQQNGKYIVKLPFNKDDKPFGKSRKMAVARLLQLEKQFKKNPEMKSKYIKCLDEYFKNKQIKLATKSEEEKAYVKDGIKIYKTNYMPHHAVKKESDRKFRVVFDASRKTTSNISLNEKLMVGPVIQSDLVTLLTKWRKYKIVFTADIEKMYRQIDVDPEDAEYQRIVWRENENEEIKDYILTTVTFGTASAPHTAVRTLKQLAMDEQQNYPVGAESLREDFYVDDVMTGGSTYKETKEKQVQLYNILQSAGERLRKFSSNNNQLLESIPEELRELRTPLEINTDQTIKTLGIDWDPANDHFQYKVNIETEDGAWTKRKILTEISKINDPLGWIAPIIIIGKIIIQKLWESKLDWDKPVSKEIEQEWKEIRNELKEIEKLKIPRWICTAAEEKFELHGFSDASEAGYGAVIYSRVIQQNGIININIICSKTKVAPIKRISIARLELCGAVLLAKLMAKIQKSLQVKDEDIKVWSDSTITLGWIKNQPNKL